MSNAYAFGDEILNRTLININDSNPTTLSAYSGTKTEQRLEETKQAAKSEAVSAAVSQAAGAAENLYVKKTDIQSAVNTSENPPSSAAVKAAVDGVSASIPGTKVNNASRADTAGSADNADRARYASYAGDLGANGWIYYPRIFFRTVNFDARDRTYGALTITYTGRSQIGSGTYAYNYRTNLSLLLMSRTGSGFNERTEFKRVKAGESIQFSTADEYWDVLCELAENTGATQFPEGTPIPIQATTYKDRNGDVIDTSVFDAISQPINP